MGRRPCYAHSTNRGAQAVQVCRRSSWTLRRGTDRSNGTDLFSMGAWAANREQGIRNYVYSTNSTINPSTYKTLDKVSWACVTLWEDADMIAWLLGCSRHRRGLG